MPDRDVALIVGSLRQASFTRKIANALVELAPASLNLDFVGIGELPLYNQEPDEAQRPPPAWTAFRERVKRADAVLFATPEYNRSMPGGLKNAIDVGSRPYGASAWDGKPGGVISVSPGAIGGFGANHHLRQSMVFLNVPMLPFEAYVGRANKLLDEQGRVTDEGTRKFLGQFLEAYAAWVERILA
jgi:chromate reductase